MVQPHRGVETSVIARQRARTNHRQERQRPVARASKVRLNSPRGHISCVARFPTLVGSRSTITMFRLDWSDVCGCFRHKKISMLLQQRVKYFLLSQLGHCPESNTAGFVARDIPGRLSGSRPEVPVSSAIDVACVTFGTSSQSDCHPKF